MKNKRREERGEGEEGEADEHMEPRPEHQGKKCTLTGTTGRWRFWTRTSGVDADWSVRGCVRRRKRRRQEEARARGGGEGDKEDKSQEEEGEGEEE